MAPASLGCEEERARVAAERERRPRPSRCRADSGKELAGVMGERSGKVVLDGTDGEPPRPLVLPDVWEVVHDGPVGDQIVDVHAGHVGERASDSPSSL